MPPFSHSPPPHLFGAVYVLLWAAKRERKKYINLSLECAWWNISEYGLAARVKRKNRKQKTICLKNLVHPSSEMWCGAHKSSRADHHFRRLEHHFRWRAYTPETVRT